MSISLDGKELARRIKDSVAQQTEELRRSGTVPTLAVVVATMDEQTEWYVQSIVRAAEATNVHANIVRLSSETATEAIAQTLTELAEDPLVHGLILQTPLPAHVDVESLVSLIPPEKDVDGVNPLSAGRLVSGLPAFAPATAEAVMAILDQYHIPPEGKEVVVVGRSRVVGKPVAWLLLNGNATVTICHSRTAHLPNITRRADILVVAVGKPNLIQADYIKEGVAIIDVGTSPDASGNMIGDVDAAAVTDKAAALTPVPGGVGPVTTALLLQHTLAAVNHKFV